MRSLGVGTLASTRAARKLYEQAQERDPTLVAAWVGHVNALDWELWLDFSAGRDEKLIAEMDRDSRRAIAIDERDPTAWKARALALLKQCQWHSAFQASERVAALDPSRFLSFSGIYILSGQSAEALQAIAKRNAMVGVADSVTFFGACDAHIHLGRYEEALSECERAAVDSPFYWVYLDLAAPYAQTGDMARAATAKTEVLKRVPDFTISRFLAKRFLTIRCGTKRSEPD
jgi:tetratricopeptide (TPR) repeat protein